MKICVVAAIAVLTSFSTLLQAQTADDAAAACEEAARLIKEKDYVGALDEAKWCVDSNSR